ncbi:integrase core domain-containing protein [Ktedonobacter sp. SOSP1-52]|uniref:integrase core domain-containing protein n=1 Tax=Ktedonobacter sp. SOSP1-52 TaxID=2778366 RepID=UPI0019158133
MNQRFSHRHFRDRADQVGTFKLAVAERYRYQSLGAFLHVAETWINFYNQQRPHEGLGNLSPQQIAEQLALERVGK